MVKRTWFCEIGISRKEGNKKEMDVSSEVIGVIDRKRTEEGRKKKKLTARGLQPFY